MNMATLVLAVSQILLFVEASRSSFGCRLLELQHSLVAVSTLKLRHLLCKPKTRRAAPTRGEEREAALHGHATTVSTSVSTTNTVYSIDY